MPKNPNYGLFAAILWSSKVNRFQGIFFLWLFTKTEKRAITSITGTVNKWNKMKNWIYINPFLANVHISLPLETPENIQFSGFPGV